MAREFQSESEFDLLKCKKMREITRLLASRCEYAAKEKWAGWGKVALMNSNKKLPSLIGLKQSGLLSPWQLVIHERRPEKFSSHGPRATLFGPNSRLEKQCRPNSRRRF
jgi:hypothetical protein